MPRTFLLLSALAFGAASAFAVDGQVLINQSTLNANGGSYTISQSGSYKLSGNLIATGNGITITASYVTLDLNGFSISGPPSYTSGIFVQPTVGVSISGNFVTVRNGAIFGFNSELQLLGLNGITGTFLQDLSLYTGGSYAGLTITDVGYGARVLNVSTDTAIGGTCPLVVANSIASGVYAKAGASFASSGPGCAFSGNGTVH